MAVDTGHEEEGGTHFSIPVPFYVASHFQLPDRVTENTLGVTISQNRPVPLPPPFAFPTLSLASSRLLVYAFAGSYA